MKSLIICFIFFPFLYYSLWDQSYHNPKHFPAFERCANGGEALRLLKKNLP